ncbi:GxxExxY protein [bacterium]|nr:GxxExxY protein [bacterium]
MKELNEKVYKIIGACLEVHRVLGPGLPVEFYKKSLEVELENKKLAFESEKSIEVKYKELTVGNLTLDFVIEGEVILAIRSQDQLLDTEVQQILRCLSFMNTPMGVLVNMGQGKIQYKRILPSRQQSSSGLSHQNQGREIRKDSHYRSQPMRFTGRTRESNPIR